MVFLNTTVNNWKERAEKSSATCEPEYFFHEIQMKIDAQKVSTKLLKFQESKNVFFNLKWLDVVYS